MSSDTSPFDLEPAFESSCVLSHVSPSCLVSSSRTSVYHQLRRTVAWGEGRGGEGGGEGKAHTENRTENEAHQSSSLRSSVCFDSSYSLCASAHLQHAHTDVLVAIFEVIEVELARQKSEADAA
jgi:hypothetical protein